jgi:23S rRNA pseudouridine1911/1915/1917 synthase
VRAHRVVTGLETPNPVDGLSTRLELLIGPDEAGQRLDKLVSILCPDLSRSYIRRLIEETLITVESVHKKPSYSVRLGERLSVRVPPPTPREIKPERISLSFVYEDDDIIVIDKPAGLVVHPAPGHDEGTLVNALLAHCTNLTVDDPVRPGIVHRLDKDTSGLMVVAKNRCAKAALADQLRAGSVMKYYLALVEQRLEPREGVIKAPIGRDPRDRKRMAIVSGGRPSDTFYRVLEYLPGHSLVEARLGTGRTHQIRVHFSSIGHPVAGDPVYGSRCRIRGLTRQFLHAYRLGLRLPSSCEYREFSSDLPSDLAGILSVLRSGV